MSEDTGIPPTWCETTVANICEKIHYGFTDSADQNGIGVKFLRISDIQDGVVDWASVPRCSLPLAGASAYLLKRGDILFARTGGTVGKSYLIAADPPDAVFASYLIRLVPKPDIFPAYIAAYFQSSAYWAQIGLNKTGLKTNVNATILGALTIPLPPLPEQKRIVAKIEELFSELDAGEESLRLARQQLALYRQSLLKQAFEGKLTEKWRSENLHKLAAPAALLGNLQGARQTRYEQHIEQSEVSGSGSRPKKSAPLQPFPHDELVGEFPLPSCWLVLRYGDLCSVVRNGISQKPSGGVGHKIARISAVRPMVFGYDDYRFIACDPDTAADYKLAKGDLVFTRYNGARRFVGVCAQFKSDEPRLYPDKLIRTRPDLPQLDPRFLEIALNCGLSRAWLETKIRTTAGQSGVSGGDVKAMPVPLCSLPEQREIVRQLDAQFEVIEQNEREIDAAIRKSEALRQSILHQAFTGKLVAQDPNDEPAAAILNRLRQSPNSGRTQTARAGQTIGVQAKRDATS